MQAPFTHSQKNGADPVIIIHQRLECVLHHKDRGFGAGNNKDQFKSTGAIEIYIATQNEAALSYLKQIITGA